LDHKHRLAVEGLRSCSSN